MRITLIILLVASLAANVFLGGFVAGKHWGPQHGGMRHERGGGPVPRDLDSLSPEGREAFRAAFRSEKADMRAAHEELRGLRKAFGETLAAEPFDRAKCEAALAALHAAEAEKQTALMTRLLDAFEKLSPADRKALAEAHAIRIEHGARRFKRRIKTLDEPPAPDAQVEPAAPDSPPGP